VWALAAAGIFCLWVLPKAPHWAIVCIYLGMGWLGFVPLAGYARAVGWRAMNWVWAGAVVYSAGAVCELAEWPVIMVWPVRVGFHEILHFCDTAGTITFFVFIARYVVPYRNPALVPEPVRAAA